MGKSFAATQVFANEGWSACGGSRRSAGTSWRRSLRGTFAGWSYGGAVHPLDGVLVTDPETRMTRLR
ncbi:hypothetical protein [Saccharopolyspora sp. CA-218241]|uniref:hypothetical protein n=1 Tax=Saccharopolyspora sp. CA-218241 TaxID=3240027 RepID=UPI003D985F5C